jgi:curli biogenesis system outer membrane secretion channel CsgG
MQHTPLLRTLSLALTTSTLIFTAACSTTPSLGGAGTVASGSAAGGNAQGANSQLEKCSEPLGTVAVVEDQNASWRSVFTQQYKMDSTVPLLRLIVQQSNCFLIVERGAAFDNMMMERELSQSGEMRNNSNMGKGQIVAADYTLKPNITFSEQTGGGSLGLGGFGLAGLAAGMVAGSMQSNEAATTLMMIDNRSSIQLVAAEGSAKNTDFGMLGGLFGGSAGGVGGAYNRTPEGKVLAAAFMDSYNNVVRAVRNYKAQSVRGGLGTGGRLGVDGGTTAASQELNPPVAVPMAPTKTRSKKKRTQ